MRISVLFYFFLALVFFASCTKENTYNEAEGNTIEYQEVELDNPCVWESVTEDSVVLINTVEEMSLALSLCDIEISESLLENKTLVLFKGMAHSGTNIGEIVYEVERFDNTNYILKINVVGSIAQACESRSVYFAAVVDKVESIESFKFEYINWDCFEYYED